MSKKKKNNSGGVKGAVLKFLGTLISLIVIPLLIYHFMPQIIAGLPESETLDTSYVEEIRPYIDRLILFAIPLVIISIPLGYFRVGDKRKVPCRIAYSFATALLIWNVTNGGHFGMNMSDVYSGDISISSLSMVIHLSVLIYISISICLMKGLTGILEYRAYRDDYKTEEIES